MKLIEKLAQEWALPAGKDQDLASESRRMGYEAGFRAGLDHASQLMKHSWEDPRFTGISLTKLPEAFAQAIILIAEEDARD